MEMNKYIEPTKAHEGKMVEVSSSIGSWVQRKLLTVLPPPQIRRFICESVDTGAPNPHSHCSWTSARISVPKTYPELHQESGLKVGDWVKVTRAAESKEHGWVNVWVARMSEYVGKTLQIGKDGGKDGFYISDADAHFPCFVLEKVDPPAPPNDEIIHVPGTVEHWIYKGHAYRLATEVDVGELAYRSDSDFKRAIGFGTRQTLSSVDTKQPMPYTVGLSWKFAYVQDDSLLKPAQPEPKYEYVPFTWDDRELLRDKWIYREGKNNPRTELKISKMTQNIDGIVFFQEYFPASLVKEWKFLDTNEPVGKKVIKSC